MRLLLLFLIVCSSGWSHAQTYKKMSSDVFYNGNSDKSNSAVSTTNFIDSNQNVYYSIEFFIREIGIEPSNKMLIKKLDLDFQIIDSWLYELPGSYLMPNPKESLPNFQLQIKDFEATSGDILFLGMNRINYLNDYPNDPNAYISRGTIWKIDLSNHSVTVTDYNNSASTISDKKNNILTSLSLYNEHINCTIITENPSINSISSIVFQLDQNLTILSQNVINNHVVFESFESDQFLNLASLCDGCVEDEVISTSIISISFPDGIHELAYKSENASSSTSHLLPGGNFTDELALFSYFNISPNINLDIKELNMPIHIIDETLKANFIGYVGNTMNGKLISVVHKERSSNIIITGQEYGVPDQSIQRVKDFKLNENFKIVLSKDLASNTIRQPLLSVITPFNNTFYTTLDLNVFELTINPNSKTYQYVYSSRENNFSTNFHFYNKLNPPFDYLYTPAMDCEYTTSEGRLNVPLSHSNPEIMFHSSSIIVDTKSTFQLNQISHTPSLNISCESVD